MKQLFHLSQISKKAIIVTSCFFLFPSSLLSAQAQTKGELRQQVTLLAQATTSENSTKADLETASAKKLATYILEFNRSPIVGNRMRLRGVYSEGRLAFTRPRGWKLDRGKIQALIRFQHSPALYANRSNLTVLVNGTSVGSVPLNRKDSQVGQVLFNIPPKLVQDYNELVLVAQQNNTLECSDPSSPDLWTEILPDSKLILNYEQQSIPLNFSRYPYPFFDELGLETNQIAYLQPSQVDQSWLTAAARLQAGLGRIADFRPIQTSLVSNVVNVKASDRLVIIGTPTEQPALNTWKNLPLKVVSNQILDRDNNPVPDETGVLMITKTEKSGVPVLIATGNSTKAVEKAIQFLSQPDLRKMGTGQVVFVNTLKESSTLGLRQWPRYLPEQNSFKLSDIKTQVNGEPFNDVTVRGMAAPPIEVDFRALPDDRFLRGSSMNLIYSYGPQLNPRTSALEVLLDGVFIGGVRLDSESGETRKNLKVNLPENLIKPNSKLQVFFRMSPREPFDKQNCLQPPDQQLTGTVHSDTSFDLKREISTQLPDLNLLKFGFPFAAPQDLSQTAIVVPQIPSKTDILTLLAFSERLGRLSQADTVKLEVYTPDALPTKVRKNDHLVGIGTREEFPFPEVFNSSGFNLNQAFSRSSAYAAIQTPQDTQGMIKQIISPWNSDRVVLALTSQTETGLERVRQVLNQDSWFFQLKKDTVLISSDQKDSVTYDADAYQLQFFQSAPNSRRWENTTPLSKASRFLQENWLLLPVGILSISLILYGIVQLYLKRLTADKK
ncbi:MULTISPECIES: cellulose biosynthesis cyclic di-GMP-binding regulatory protein BcsB [unclassified Nostoc]|uniref:cellulose biosynthesis cyclic di-GMP-binding regulatory protein BcsB n=1 Tax=unclassified Nostoc TaxID=2593658 RepID=UPI00261614CA|nr:cellulose biosynthesis cyclic di-GMP-binding regulatory protein BcsB [Nostoc sp. S13]MDF5734904.1 cellulose biosynthesis cyclic di-GMP-binding regulatory protein BcsB [Nostoc sp. S13]